jgi:hypothetical protein
MLVPQVVGGSAVDAKINRRIPLAVYQRNVQSLSPTQ